MTTAASNFHFKQTKYRTDYQPVFFKFLQTQVRIRCPVANLQDSTVLNKDRPLNEHAVRSQEFQCLIDRQLVKSILEDLTVIATASRPETQEWVRGLGAHHVIDHSRPLAPQIAELGIGAPAFVFSTTHTEQHVADIAELIAPQGRFGLIDDPKAFDIMVFKRKAVSIHHELMFTRSIYGTPDMNEQGEILDAMAALVDDGKIRTTLTRRLSPINAANLKTVHALIESGAAKGKIVLEGF